jgi:hypothetical protein
MVDLNDIREALQTANSHITHAVVAIETVQTADKLSNAQIRAINWMIDQAMKHLEAAKKGIKL